MPAPDALLDEFVRAAANAPDRLGFARVAVGALRRVVPFDGVAVVWFDPETTLPVDMWIDNPATGSAEAERALLEAEVDEFRQLAASGKRAARVSGAIGGDELRAVCVGDSGMWGAVALRRDGAASRFTTRDEDLLASLAGGFEEVQRARLERDLAAETGDHERGLLLLDDDDGVEMADAAAAAWLDELRDGRRRLPLVVTAVADRARDIASGRSDVAATARVRAASGRWFLARGSVLANGTHARTAVTLEPARAPELAGLIADAYGLTARERRVTELVAQGLPNAAIAAQLFLSTYTVQDHLKAIFEKLAVSSRGALVARLFVDHSLLSG